MSLAEPWEEAREEEKGNAARGPRVATPHPEEEECGECGEAQGEETGEGA